MKQMLVSIVFVTLDFVSLTWTQHAIMMVVIVQAAKLRNHLGGGFCRGGYYDNLDVNLTAEIVFD